MGATPDEVAPTSAVMATAMLVEVCGSTAEATASCGSLELVQNRGWGRVGLEPTTGGL